MPPRQTQKLTNKAGTLFLDEINSLGVQHQAKLLRIIQEKEVQMVGEDTTRPIELKIVCATNQDLLEEAREGNFRKDLYYRISKGIVRLPSLREMPDTIIEIANGILTELSTQKPRYTTSGLTKSAPKIKKETEIKLKKHNWPGNIRELSNVMYRAYIQMCQEDKETIHSHHLDLPTDSENFEALPANPTNYKEAVAEFEKEYLEGILKTNKGNKAATAREVEMDRTTLDRTLNRLNINPHSFKNP